jgi:4-hydroxythreonine-4-phosphate dehydrogenase
MSDWISISLGDVTGIGPEVALKALAAELHTDDTRYLLIGDSALLHRLNKEAGLGLPLVPFQSTQQAGRVFVHQPSPAPLPEGLSPGCAAAAQASVLWLAEGARLCLQGDAKALVTAPVNKASILQTGQRFIGQTELLAELAGTQDSFMMLLGQDDRQRWLRVVLATTHLPLRRVADHLDAPRITMLIERAAQACRDLGLPTARIGVCGLNPHAGEEGRLGDEEAQIITPAIRAARDRTLDVTGPWPADTLFHRAYRGEFDVVVAMYHDQGLGPLKMIAFETGVNWTLGLPFIRTSPDHGTAYDIAGKNVANPSSMIAAIRLARQLVRLRRTPPNPCQSPGPPSPVSA